MDRECTASTRTRTDGTQEVLTYMTLETITSMPDDPVIDLPSSGGLIGPAHAGARAGFSQPALGREHLPMAHVRRSGRTALTLTSGSESPLLRARAEALAGALLSRRPAVFRQPQGGGYSCGSCKASRIALYISTGS